MVHLGPYRGRDLSITVQSISKMERRMLALDFLSRNLRDTFASWPRKWGSSGPTVTTHHNHHLRHASCVRCLQSQ